MANHRDQQKEPENQEVVVRGSLDFDKFYRAEFRKVLGLVGVLSGSKWAEEMRTQ